MTNHLTTITGTLQGLGDESPKVQARRIALDISVPAGMEVELLRGREVELGIQSEQIMATVGSETRGEATWFLRNQSFSDDAIPYKMIKIE